MRTGCRRMTNMTTMSKKIMSGRNWGWPSDDGDDYDLDVIKTIGQGGMEDQPMEASASAIQPRHSHRAWRYVPSVLMIKKNKKQTKITSNKHQQQLQSQNFHNTWRHAPSVLMIINNNKTTSPNKTKIHNRCKHGVPTIPGDMISNCSRSPTMWRWCW